ncbi:low temperature requirement protein A [Companilactobacillus huachuanensis]|uniref:Low temperature requirement protein A n=1 Tax=Companilactobacillus huachuanensis TaxID=2559914 RepID=A0ABW1RP07_9LACO|nr:low temperature requirement protein A [Companilactobacillus huachuanensis]
MNKLIPKKVELTELFYDLVFVYAVSKLTGLISHLPEGSSFFQQFVIFSIMLIVFINTWMVETVFTNRYGKNSIENILFFMFDMAIVLFMSNNIDGNIQQWFRPFTLAAALLSATLVLQYLLVYLRSHKQVDKNLTRLFVYILSLRTILLLVGALLPFKIGLTIALIGVLSSWILPGIFTSKMTGRAINFPHLLERLTALIIISFGETIVDIADYFKISEFNIFSVLIFIIICALFMVYITQFDHFIDENKTKQTGNRLIYLHYPVLFGISLITVSLDFIGEEEFSKTAATMILYAGLILFYLGIFLADIYNKSNIKKERHVKIIFIASTLLGLLFCNLFKNFDAIVLITTLVTVINSFTLSESMVRQSRF